MVQDTSRHPAAEPWAKRVFAVTLFVDDLAISKRFYRDVFEMPVANEDESSCAFRFPGIVVNLVAAASASQLIEPAPVGESGTPARTMLTLEVRDVDATCERLRARGVTFLNGPLDRPWGPRTATFADPSGHCWELSD
jgi:lactoylglutathione lyase